VLNIIKSNTEMNVINRTFVITENGIPCSLKTHNTDYISVGRQQINDQGIRPNDIMLFPTDPSISRSHFKIFHKEYFNKIKSFQRLSEVFSLLSKSYLNPDLIYDILKYIKPKPTSFMIEDVGTIYGTYVKVPSFSLHNCLINLYLILSHGCPFEFSLQTLAHFNEHRMHNTLSENYILDNFLDIANFPKLNSLTYISLFERTIGLKIDLSIKGLLKENNTIIVPGSVFLSSSKSGYIIPATGSYEDMIRYMEKDYKTYGEGFNSTVCLICNQRLLRSMKYDNYSKTYKTIIPKEVFYTECKHLMNCCDMAYFVELAGDPCGVMTRPNDAIFVYWKGDPCFEFNHMPGFLVGNDNTCSYIIESEGYGLIYCYQGVWMISDLTKFIRPNVYYSHSYYGLWQCVSLDKSINHRWGPRKFEVKSGDEIKVSETVFKVKVIIDN
jgi:hypothetical protein